MKALKASHDSEWSEVMRVSGGYTTKAGARRNLVMTDAILNDRLKEAI